MVSRTALDVGALYDAHVDFVWRMLERLGVPPANLEDATQEVFLIVHRRRADFRHASSVRTWLGGIAIRVAKDFRRAVTRRGAIVDLERALAVGHAETGPHDAAVASQAMNLMQRLLETLDDDQRTVFVLTELEELTAVEIAEITGANVNTVSSRLRLARKHFNERMNELQARAGGM